MIWYYCGAPTLFLCSLHSGLSLVVAPVEDGDGETLISDVQCQVLAHDSKTDKADRADGSGHLGSSAQIRMDGCEVLEQVRSEIIKCSFQYKVSATLD